MTDNQLVREKIAKHLKGKFDFPMLTSDAVEITRIIDKLKDNDLAPTRENIDFILEEYGEEVLNPVISVVFD